MSLLLLGIIVCGSWLNAGTKPQCPLPTVHLEDGTLCQETAALPSQPVANVLIQQN